MEDLPRLTSRFFKPNTKNVILSEAPRRSSASKSLDCAEAKDLGEIEGRLLKLVLSELRRDFQLGAVRTHAIYYRRSDPRYFWNAKEADFAKVAEEALAKRNQSGSAVVGIANYLFWGIGRPARAIEILCLWPPESFTPRSPTIVS